MSDERVQETTEHDALRDKVRRLEAQVEHLQGVIRNAAWFIAPPDSKPVAAYEILFAEVYPPEVQEALPHSDTVDHAALSPREGEGGRECEWKQWDDGDFDTWGTSCGQAFTLNEGSPSYNDMRFCSYCGKPLKETPYVEEYEDEEPAAALSAAEGQR